MACLVFELVTGDFLFDPKSGSRFSRDDDHLAQMIELLGNMPRSLCLAGKNAREYFTKDGRLRHIERLKYWPLRAVLVDKYDLDEEEVRYLFASMGSWVHGFMGSWVHGFMGSWVHALESRWQ
jgi:serine/threonine-protein kinase SRPK3